jgi:hypothetical protein
MEAKMDIQTGLGTFVPNGTEPLSTQFKDHISLLFGPEAITSIALTVINYVVGLGIIALVMVDNKRIYKTWRVVPSNRIPLALAAAICLSHAFFIIKSFLGLASFHDFDPPKDVRLACRVFGELGFWGTIFLYFAHFRNMGTSCYDRNPLSIRCPQHLVPSIHLEVGLLTCSSIRMPCGQKES